MIGAFVTGQTVGGMSDPQGRTQSQRPVDRDVQAKIV
jgi:hypothetical protein